MKQILAGLAAAVLLVACAEDEAALAPPCPATFVVQEIADLTLFKPGEGRDLTDVDMQATIVGFDGFCETDFDEGTAGEVVVELRLLLTASRGPANTTRKGAFDYFVAITDREENPVQKHVFTSEVEFPRNRNRLSPFEELSLTIPLKARENGADYTVLVGFQLTPEQVEYNQNRQIR